MASGPAYALGSAGRVAATVVLGAAVVGGTVAAVVGAIVTAMAGAPVGAGVVGLVVGAVRRSTSRYRLIRPAPRW